MQTELETLRREIHVYETIFEKIAELADSKNDKDLKGIVFLLNCNLIAATRDDKFILQSIADRFCRDIQSICQINFNFSPTIIINRKNNTCCGVYIKNRKDLGIGIGEDLLFALKDLKIKCILALKNKNESENKSRPIKNK